MVGPDSVWARKLADKPLLDALCVLLKPFWKESKYLQANKTPTLQLCIPSLQKMEGKCAPRESDTEELAIVRAAILEQLTTKAQITMKHKIATFLWPQTRQLTMLKTPAEIEEVIHLL